MLDGFFGLELGCLLVALGACRGGGHGVTGRHVVAPCRAEALNSFSDRIQFEKSRLVVADFLRCRFVKVLILEMKCPSR